MYTFSPSIALSVPQQGLALPVVSGSRETAAGKDSLQQTRLYSSATLDIAYNRLHHYLYCNWKGAQTPETLQEGTNMLLTLLKGQGCDRLLIDNRKVKGAFGAASRWMRMGLFGALQNSGLVKVSWLVSSDPFVHLANVLPMRQLSGNGSFARTFSDENAAKLWLLERLN